MKANSRALTSEGIRLPNKFHQPSMEKPPLAKLNHQALLRLIELGTLYPLWHLPCWQFQSHRPKEQVVERKSLMCLHNKVVYKISLSILEEDDFQPQVTSLKESNFQLEKLRLPWTMTRSCLHTCKITQDSHQVEGLLVLTTILTLWAKMSLHLSNLLKNSTRWPSQLCLLHRTIIQW